MKVIKQGKDMFQHPELFEKECPICGCVFQYERKDIQMQGRNETFIKCPNRSCGNKIEV